MPRRSPGALPLALWSGAARLAAPAIRLLLLDRARRGKEIGARLAERRGIEAEPRPPGRLLWMHAASVGETISILPVLDALAAADPGLALLLTTGTNGSAAIAQARLPAQARHRFAPLDVPRWVGRFLDHWRPDAGCFVESEIWPNTLHAAARRGIPLALLNARLSDSSARRWGRAPGLARRLFGGFALIQARSGPDADRLAALAGGPVGAPGDLKFAAPPLPADPAGLLALRDAIGAAPAWVAASIHPGEDAIAAAVHERLLAHHPGLITIMVPRHPSRAAAMAAALPAPSPDMGPIPRRSLGQPPVPGRLYLADTLGELGLFYRLGRCALVGGSLVPHGGQNPLEPARLACPVAIGPHTGNFLEACAVLRQAGALATVTGPADLAAWAHPMLSDPSRRAAAGAAASAAAQRWADLPDRTARALLALMRPG